LKIDAMREHMQKNTLQCNKYIHPPSYRANMAATIPTAPITEAPVAIAPDFPVLVVATPPAVADVPVAVDRTVVPITNVSIL
jgi:hypothetical protein